MNRANLRIAIIFFGLVTALVHFYLLIRPGYGFDFVIPGLFLYNGLAYLVLLGALFLPIHALDGVRRYVPWLLILFTAVTIAAFFQYGDPHDPVGWVTKADEALLIVATLLYALQRS